MLSREKLLERQVTALQQENQQLQQEMLMRAMPTFTELVDAMDNLIRGAQKGNAEAKALLAKFLRSLEAARDAASPLAVIRS